VIAAVKIWDLSIEGDAEVVNVPTDRQPPVDVAYLPDGHVVASHGRGSVAIWDVGGDTTEPSETLGPAGGSDVQVFQIATSPDGERVAMVRDFSSVVSVWNVETGTLAFDHDIHSGVITSIDWSGDGRYLAVGTWDDGDEGSLYVLDADDGGRHIVVGSEPDPIRAVAFAPDGRTIAAATYNQPDPGASHVSIWDPREREVVLELGVEASSLAYDGSGERLAIGSYNGTVQIRDASTGDVERSFGAGSVTVMQVVFSPDGDLLATSGEDATVRLFDTRAESGAQKLVLRGHELLVSGLDFSPDGKHLVSSSPDGVVRVWTLDLDELIAIAEDELTRPLSDDECRQYLHLQGGCP